MAGAPEGFFIERHAEAIGISADTLAAVKAAAEAGRKAAAEKFEDLNAARKRLDTLLREKQPDEAALLRETEAMGRAWTANLEERMRTSVKIRQLLNDEERTKLAELRAHPPRRANQPMGAPSGPSPGMVIDRGAP